MRRYAKDGSVQPSYSAKREGNRQHSSSNAKEGHQSFAQLKVEMADLKAVRLNATAKRTSDDHTTRSATS